MQTLWNLAKDSLKRALSEDSYDRWIEPIKPLSLSETELMLGVDNEFCQQWLNDNYLGMIEDAVHANSAEFVSVRLVIPEGSREDSARATNLPLPPKKASPPRPRAAPPVPENLSLNPEFTFEKFVVGPSNSFAHAATFAVSENPGKAYNPLFIYGPTGLGKTHLIQSVGNRMVGVNRRAKVAYVTSEMLLNEYIEATMTGKHVEFRKKYRSVDILLIDDIQFLAGKDRLQEEFFHTFNALYDAKKQIIITSDQPPKEIKGLEARLVSRFEWGMVTELEYPDFETRLAILRYKHSSAQVRLSDAILTFIAENVQSNVRSLEGALTRATSFAALTPPGIQLTVDMLRNLLKDLLAQERQADLTFDDIQRAVAEHFGIKMVDMSSKERSRSVALPRQIAMYLCRKMTRASLPEIATAFEKTHATVIHGCKAIQNRLDTESDLKSAVQEIVRKLGRDASLL